MRGLAQEEFEVTNFSSVTESHYYYLSLTETRAYIASPIQLKHFTSHGNQWGGHHRAACKIVRYYPRLFVPNTLG